MKLSTTPIGEQLVASDLNDLEAIFLAASERGLRLRGRGRKRYWKVAEAAGGAIVGFTEASLTEFRFTTQETLLAVDALGWYVASVSPQEAVMPSDIDQAARQAHLTIRPKTDL